MIIVSKCLLGINCKYSGGNNKNEQVISFLAGKNIIPVCPEELGGLSTPRLPAEITGGNGFDVLSGQAQVKSSNGRNITRQFLQGASEVKKLVLKYNVTMAVMKERSPSCGVTEIYNGTFSRITGPGPGVCTALLKSFGIPVVSETTLPKKPLNKKANQDNKHS